MFNKLTYLLANYRPNADSYLAGHFPAFHYFRKINKILVVYGLKILKLKWHEPTLL